MIALGKLDEFDPGTSFDAWDRTDRPLRRTQQHGAAQRRPSRSADPVVLDSSPNSDRPTPDRSGHRSLGSRTADEHAFDDAVVRPLHRWRKPLASLPADEDRAWPLLRRDRPHALHPRGHRDEPCAPRPQSNARSTRFAGFQGRGRCVMTHAPGGNTPGPIIDQIDAYLDGTLSSADRAAFSRNASHATRRIPSRPRSGPRHRSLAETHPRSRRHHRTHAPSLRVLLGHQAARVETLRAASLLARHRRRRALLFLAVTAYQIYTRIDWKFHRYNAAEYYTMAAQIRSNQTGSAATTASSREATGYSTGQQMLVKQDLPAKIDLVGWVYSQKFEGTPLHSSTVVLYAKVDDVPGRRARRQPRKRSEGPTRRRPRSAHLQTPTQRASRSSTKLPPHHTA